MPAPDSALAEEPEPSAEAWQGRGSPTEERKSLKPGSLPYIWKKITRNGGAMAGLLAVLIIMTASLLSPLILKHHYAVIDITKQYARPSADHIFGCDELGRDILARVLFGARYTLSIGFLSVIISAGFGIVLGAAAGFFGGMTDAVIMRFLDIFQAFPQDRKSVV